MRPVSCGLVPGLCCCRQVLGICNRLQDKRTYDGAVFMDESSWLRRSANGGFCILLRSESGALTTRRAMRGGPES